MARHYRDFVSGSPARFIIFGWREKKHGARNLRVFSLCFGFSRVNTYQTRVHSSLFVAGAEHFLVKLQDDVFELVPGVADAIVHDGDVDLLKEVGPRFTCAKPNQRIVRIAQGIQMKWSSQFTKRCVRLAPSGHHSQSSFVILALWR